MSRLPLAAVALAVALAGCLPTSDYKVSIQVLDEETGAPIAGAWVLPSAHVITVPPVDRFEVVAAERARSGADGVARFTRLLGLYRPNAPDTPLWRLVDAKQAAIRKPGHIAGGSIVVAAAGYGMVHQPFAVEDSPEYQDWLKANAGRPDGYMGLLGGRVLKENRPPLILRTQDLKEGVLLTLRLKKPANAVELGSNESFRSVRFMSATWHATSRKTGASEDDQREIYEFFAQQMKAVADETGEPWHREMYETYFNQDARKKFISEDHALPPEAQNGDIQRWLTRKALEILPPEAAETKVYANDILAAVVEEGKYPNWQNHFLDPQDPGRGLPGSDSALAWAGLDEDNPRNEWDWQDARRHYEAQDRRKAYIALGHVLRTLTNLSIPKYAELDQSLDTEFERAVKRELEANLGHLPPDFWHSARGPAFALTPRARFEAVAGARASAGRQEARASRAAGSIMRDAVGGEGALDAAKAIFPTAIAQAAGLLWDFHRLTHPTAFVQAPGHGNGNGNGGPQAVQQSSGTATSTTDAANGGSEGVKSRAPGSEPSGLRWQTDNGELRLKDAKGSVNKRIALENEEKILAVHPEHKFTEKKLVMSKAGVSKDGNFAWTDRRESTWLLSGNKGSILFQYFNRNGELLWEKSTVTGATLSDDGKVVALLESDPKAIAMNEHGNTFARPSIFSSEGKLLLDLTHCRTYSDVALTNNGRFGAVRCTEDEPKYRDFQLLFDVETKRIKEISVPGVEVHDDGTYTVVGIEQKFDPKTKRYGDFVRSVISHGRIE